MYLKTNRTYSFGYSQFIEARDKPYDYISVYTGGSLDGNYVVCATIVPSVTVISKRLLHSAEICAFIKALKQIKDSIASKYTIFRTHFRVLIELFLVSASAPRLE